MRYDMCCHVCQRLLEFLHCLPSEPSEEVSSGPYPCYLYLSKPRSLVYLSFSSAVVSLSPFGNLCRRGIPTAIGQQKYHPTQGRCKGRGRSTEKKTRKPKRASWKFSRKKQEKQNGINVPAANFIYPSGLEECHEGKADIPIYLLRTV